MIETLAPELFHYLLHPYPTFLVTCMGQAGQPNVLSIAWLIPASVEPPRVVMSIRPSRHSYALLEASKEFVVNVPSCALASEVLRCGRRSGRTEDKFVATGLTPRPARHVRAPIIEECLAYLECRMVDDLEAGDHRLVIAEVLDAYARRGFLDQDGLRDVGCASPLLHVGKNRFLSVKDEAIEPTLPEDA
jgi:flavin reductase (DIM6/NTAB) family NADH-FMN oxidoreductase RutF